MICERCGLTIPTQTCKHCGKPRDQWPEERRTNQHAEYCRIQCVRARNDRNHRLKTKQERTQIPETN